MIKRRRSVSPSSRSNKTRRVGRRSPTHGGFSPSPERTITTHVVDPELDQELTQLISTRRNELINELLEAPVTQTRVQEQIKKVYMEAIQSPDLSRDIAQLILKEQDKLKQYAMQQSSQIGDRLIEIVCAGKKKMVVPKTPIVGGEPR
eukprot:TRINITY_DN3466_c0_g1_i7.p1 TRINITY_DN3466_c0_g1~~TRINITY_DN3466_c0_g1_i7.p1  ORF type:complete len:148 (-),score=28.33 TRINITY_DN3466_c0_g1_i7:795-1238(-)